MSHTDANWRSGGGMAPYLPPFNPGGQSTVDLLPFTRPTVNVFPIACGTTTDWYVRSTDLPPVYRSNNFADNAGYHAAHGTLQITSAGPVEITLTGITDAVLTWDAQHRWYADSGVIQIDVPIEQIGPYVLEVWSAGGGAFSVHVTCTTGLAAYWTFDSATELTAGAALGALPDPPDAGSWTWPGGSSSVPGDTVFTSAFVNTQTPATPSLYADEVSGLALPEVIAVAGVNLNFTWSAAIPWSGSGIMGVRVIDTLTSNEIYSQVVAAGGNLLQTFSGIIGVATGTSYALDFRLQTSGGPIDPNSGTITFDSVTQA